MHRRTKCLYEIKIESLTLNFGGGGPNNRGPVTAMVVSDDSTPTLLPIISAGLPEAMP